ncbi:MAG: hypothetical protein LBR36_07805 [Bacteroidales bacterium]|jgi:hypothetical protein|nr:hypothetical protein [Bacteroidales bacterium]
MFIKAPHKFLWIFLFFFIVWLIIAIVLFTHSRHQTIKIEQRIAKIYDNIQLKGKIIKIHKLKRDTWICGVMCVKIDYATVNDFFMFDENSCLKIQNGIATLPTGSLSMEESEHVKDILNATYIEINMNNSNQIVFFDSNNIKTYHDLYYGNSLLKEKDLQLCDECEKTDL